MRFPHILALTGLAGLVASQVTVGPIEVDGPIIDDDDIGDFNSGTLTVIVAGSTVVVEVTESTTITIGPHLPFVSIGPDNDDDDDDKTTQNPQPTQGGANPATVVGSSKKLRPPTLTSSRSVILKMAVANVTTQSLPLTSTLFVPNRWLVSLHFLLLLWQCCKSRAPSSGWLVEI